MRTSGAKETEAAMSYGPIEFLVVKFPGNQFNGEIAPALKELVDNGLIRVIDLLFVGKDADGTVAVLDLDELGEAIVTALDPLVAEVCGLLSDEDARRFASALEPNSSEGLLVFENIWASRFAQAIRNASGEVILNERIPHAVVEAVFAAAEAEG
jgi:hypothetical protein